MKKEITEGNALIALFMDAEAYPVNGFPDTYQFLSGAIYGLYRKSEGTPNYVNLEVSNMKFHASWEWLMPVVERINSMGYDSRILYHWVDGEYFCDFVDQDNNEFGIGADVIQINAVYNAVLQFIHYHNSLNSK